MLTLFCGDEPVTELRDAARSTPTATARSSGTCSTRGIYVAPCQYECVFLSLAHGDEEIDATVEAVADFFA